MESQPQHLSRLKRAARSAALRERVNGLNQVACRWLPLPLAYATFSLTYIKLQHPGANELSALYLGGALAFGGWLGLLASVWLRPRAAEAGALLLDHFHGLQGRIANGLSFAELPLGARTPFMLAAIVDAESVALELSPKRAVPWRKPRELPLVLGLLFGLLGLSLLEVRVARELPVPVSAPTRPLVLAADDIEYFQEIAARLQESPHREEMNGAIARFNQLVLDIAAERVTRSEVFHRLDALERDLGSASIADKEALELALKERARELKSSQLSRGLGEALERQDVAGAEKELRSLAEKLRQKNNGLSQRDLERLKQAFEKASQQTKKSLERVEARRQELLSQKRSLLNKKKNQKSLSPREAEQQKELDRKLERLDREKRQATRSGKGLQGLDKELAEAAQNLMKEAGLSAKDLEQGAEQMNTTSQQQASDQEKQQLKKRLQELRELLRQQGQAGREQMKRLLRFGQKARGQQGPPGRAGQSGEGTGKGEKGPLKLGRGSGGPALELPGGQGEGAPGNGKPAGGSSDGSPGAQGAEYGSGHDENLRGEASKLEGRYKDVSAVAPDTGEGSASAEVIYGAAQRGFRGRGYTQVYTDYRTVAEAVISSDEIPAGYRFYVRRYFQLIRPRE